MFLFSECMFKRILQISQELLILLNLSINSCLFKPYLILTLLNLSLSFKHDLQILPNPKVVFAALLEKFSWFFSTLQVPHIKFPLFKASSLNNLSSFTLLIPLLS